MAAMSYRKLALLAMLVLLLVLGAGGAFAQSIPPAAADMLAGKAPLRLLMAARQTMLAWKGVGDVHVVNMADGVTLYTMKPGEMVGIVYDADGAGCRLRQDGKNFLAVPASVRLVSDKPVNVWTPSPDNWQTYDGTVVIVPTAGGTFSVTREIMLEDYLRYVVAGEMPNTFHPQALLAQAVIARTYALIKLGRHAAEGADVCVADHCQVYGSKRTPETDRAVSATRGLVLLFGDKLAEPYYSSTCGGVTGNAGLLWGPEYSRPYLQGVPDMPAKSAPAKLTIDSILKVKDPYCQDSSGNRWTRQFTAAEVNALVAKNLPLVTNDPAVRIQTVVNMSIEERTPDARVASLRIEGDGASVLVFGDAVRWLFGNGKPGASGLWSALFDLTVTRDTAGAITGYTFRGAGRGHGIGLCQWGANGRAKAGQTFREILHAYYPGTRLSDETK